MDAHLMKITKNTRAVDALRLSNNVVKIFRKHDLYCPGCKGLVEETIEKIAVCNGMDVQKFLDELNGSLE
jgi:beta-galactosidase beta subunit